jgi:A/G-specific adenine glycosylase
MSARLPGNALAFKRRLLKWFRSVGRDLPWRRTRDPYHIVVSEFMLQQTQVARVMGFYRRFLTRFPTIRALADANPAEVREAWDGLGYYRRAANLSRLARIVVERYDGRVPHDLDRLGALPGIGRYTAGAVASFAYEKRVPAVDTNVARVLGRVFPRAAGRAGSRSAQRRQWELARRLLPRQRQRAWEFNQALMDLGARYCTARRPRCSECPVRPACRTGASGQSTTRPQSARCSD